MRVIALTGGIGSGKSTVAAELARCGAEVIDSDKISYEIMLPSGRAYKEVLEAFGESILKPDKTIDRKRLGDIVFCDEKKLKKLTDITHKMIFAEMESRIERSKAGLVCLEIPLLFTSENPIPIDLSVAVVAPKEMRIKRVMARDNCTREQVEARMAKQLSDEEMQKLADCVIVNDGDMDNVKEQVLKICSM